MPDNTYLKINDVSVPLKIKREWRSTVRYSISRKSVNLTVPKFYKKDQVINELQKINNWAKTQFLKNPSMIDRFRGVQYKSGQSFKIYNNNFKLLIHPSSNKGLTAELEHEVVNIYVPHDLDGSDRNKLIGQLLSRLFAKHFYQNIKSRVEDLNLQHFQEEINVIRIKNNQSNWGSCSTNRNINLSSRLLFAPDKVIEYVIIHELAHLKEMNHSQRFWNIVASAMPDYKKYDSWLTKHGHNLIF